MWGCLLPFRVDCSLPGSDAVSWSKTDMAIQYNIFELRNLKDICGRPAESFELR